MVYYEIKKVFSKMSSKIALAIILVDSRSYLLVCDCGGELYR